MFMYKTNMGHQNVYIDVVNVQVWGENVKGAQKMHKKAKRSKLSHHAFRWKLVLSVNH